MRLPYIDPKLCDLSEGLSLYIHIPFCRQKCYFCDFFSVQGWSEDKQSNIVAEILSQAKTLLALLNIDSIQTAYIGGGTPSLLSHRQLEEFLSLIDGYHPKELTVEANPESLTSEWTNVLFSYPNTRLSLGVQSFLVEDLEALGRSVNSQEVLQALEDLAPYSHQINIDLIAGLKNHTWQSVKQEINQILQFQPAHISFYMLTIEEGTPLYRRPFLVAKETQRTNLWLKGKELLNQSGYIDYEISNFTKRHPSKHNQKYWSLSPYLGIGPGAVSNLPLLDGCALRIEGSKRLHKWIKPEKTSILYEEKIIEKNDFIFEHLMMGLRTRKGIEKATLEQRFGSQWQDMIGMAQMAYPDFIKIDSDRIRLTEPGRLHLDRILISLLKP